jgi:uncharacterized OB-fold protein
MSDNVRDAGYDDFLDALADGEGHYLECENGHGSLPPRRVCPHCGARDLTETPLPETGTVESTTEIHVPTPSFADDAPYVVAVVDFGAVRLTGQVRGDESGDAVESGLEVEAGVGETETEGERLLVFEPR